MHTLLSAPPQYPPIFVAVACFINQEEEEGDAPTEDSLAPRKSSADVLDDDDEDETFLDRRRISADAGSFTDYADAETSSAVKRVSGQAVSTRTRERGGGGGGGLNGMAMKSWLSCCCCCCCCCLGWGGVRDVGAMPWPGALMGPGACSLFEGRRRPVRMPPFLSLGLEEGRMLVFACFFVPWLRVLHPQHRVNEIVLCGTCAILRFDSQRSRHAVRELY